MGYGEDFSCVVLGILLLSGYPNLGIKTITEYKVGVRFGLEHFGRGDLGLTFIHSFEICK